MNILVTGCAGFIGSRFCEWIIKNHPEAAVYGVDDLSGGNRNTAGMAGVSNLMLGGTGCTLDWGIFDWPRFDVVYHCAAYAAECLSPFIRRFNYRNNVEATAEVVNYCINTGVRRLVFTSSIAVYGACKDSVLHEDSTCLPLDPYGVAKLACEHDIRIAGEQHGLEWCVLRPHNVYGVGQNLHDRYRNVLGIWMKSAYLGGPITVYGSGEQGRQFTPVENLLQPLWEAGMRVDANRLVANIGDSSETSLLDLAKAVSDVTGAPIIHAPPRHEADHPYCNHYRAGRYLGYSGGGDLRAGIETMWAWAKEELSKPSPCHTVPMIEVTKGMPIQWP